MTNIPQKSGLWKHGLLLAMLFGFTVMIVGGVMMYRSRAPIPEQVTAPDGSVLFTAADIRQGQELFRKRGLMDYGTVLGHGAYLGPDYSGRFPRGQSCRRQPSVPRRITPTPTTGRTIRRRAIPPQRAR
jgi:nitric oxide reductase large subunit